MGRIQGKKRARLGRKTASLRQQIEALEKCEQATLQTTATAKFPNDIHAMMRKPPTERPPLEKQLAALAYRQVQYEFDHLKLKDPEKKQYEGLVKELAKFDALKPKLLAPAAPWFAMPSILTPAVHIPKKSAGPAIEPGFLTILDENPAAIKPPPALTSTGRRLALANWLTRPDNPLTTRVIVNRIWQYHFGRGLVPTASDFGKLGERWPLELLDWLAERFVADGWSIKKMHRLLVTSMTYRQAATSEGSQVALSKDPDNRLWWKMTTPGSMPSKSATPFSRHRPADWPWGVRAWIPKSRAAAFTPRFGATRRRRSSASLTRPRASPAPPSAT